MNNKIKEILKDIEKGVKTGKDRNEIKVGGICYEWKDLKVLLDYITNLQQENERLKFQLEYQQIITSKYRMRKNIYKSRCEKASEYIKSTTFFGLRSGKTFMSKYLNDLLNILQNGSEE